RTGYAIDSENKSPEIRMEEEKGREKERDMGWNNPIRITGEEEEEKFEHKQVLRYKSSEFPSKRKEIAHIESVFPLLNVGEGHFGGVKIRQGGRDVPGVYGSVW
ncbi:7752_t:CDS:2, partial [Acaulospora colombiana]